MSPLNWQRSIEQIALAPANQPNRVLGLTSVHRGAGLSLICRLVARTIASSGSRALLIDMSEPQPSSAAAIRGDIRTTSDGYDVLAGRAEDGSPALFGKLPRLREMLRTDFADYDHIILDLPPIFDSKEHGFSTVAAATICDRLLLVCAVGIDKRAEVASVASLLRSAGVPLAGLISNEHRRVDVWEELSRLGLRWLRRQRRTGDVRSEAGRVAGEDSVPG